MTLRERLDHLRAQRDLVMPNDGDNIYVAFRKMADWQLDLADLLLDIAESQTKEDRPERGSLAWDKRGG